MYNRMKPPYFTLNIGLLFSYLFRIRIRVRIRNPDPKSGSETGYEMSISVPDRIRIRPKVPAPDPQHCYILYVFRSFSWGRRSELSKIFPTKTPRISTGFLLTGVLNETM
jgi:hypothetical protein